MRLGRLEIKVAPFWMWRWLFRNGTFYGRFYTYRNGVTGEEKHAQVAAHIWHFGPVGVRVWTR